MLVPTARRAAPAFVLSLGLWWVYDPAGAAIQLPVNVPWIPEWGIHYRLGIDGIFCPNESTTFGMLRALQNGGWAGKVTFVEN